MPGHPQALAAQFIRRQSAHRIDVLAECICSRNRRRKAKAQARPPWAGSMSFQHCSNCSLHPTCSTAKARRSFPLLKTEFDGRLAGSGYCDDEMGMSFGPSSVWRAYRKSTNCAGKAEPAGGPASSQVVHPALLRSQPLLRRRFPRA